MKSPKVNRILFPSDLSQASDRALAHVRILAQRFDAGVVLYHAAEIPDHCQPHWAFAHGHEVWARAAREAREALAQQAETLGVPCEVLVERVASPHRALLTLIRERQPDLTVMATHARKGVPHIVLGSVTEHVFRHAFRPVLCIPEPEADRHTSYQRILLPTDFSAAAGIAFPLAALLARAFDSRVIALHVAHPHGPQAQTADIPSEAALWKSTQPELEGVEIVARVHEGTVWDQIVNTARVEHADLIVMSTRGHDSLSDVVLGSNTDRVVRHAPCPVLVA
jgi:nucleotide-binding universal stress UspA family protein